MLKGKPVIVVGWFTIARLIHGQDVEVEGATLIPASDVTNICQWVKSIGKKEEGKDAKA